MEDEGFGGGEGTDKIEIIDIGSASPSCQDLTNFPTKFYGAIGGLASNSNPIICGGMDGTINDIVADCFTYKDGDWNMSPGLFWPLLSAAVSPTGCSNEAFNLFSTGGMAHIYPAGFAPISVAQVLSDAGWQELSNPLENSSAFHCMVLLQPTSVLVIGGVQDETWYSSSTFFFDTDTEEWSDGPKLNGGRRSFSCGKLQADSGSSQDRVIVAGGWNGAVISSTEILDVDSIYGWSSGPELPIGILGASMIEDSSRGVILIGGSNGNVPLNTLYKLSHAKSEWIVMPQQLKIGRSYATAFLVPDEVTNC